MDPQALRDEVIKTYHLENMPEEKQTEMIEQIGSLIFQGVMLRVVPGLSEKAQAQFENILNADGSPDDLMNFLSKEVPNIKDIFKEEADTFQKESAAIMGAIGK